MSYSRHHRGQFGFSLIEILVSLILIGIFCKVAITNIRVLENPLTNASANLTHYFRLVRARAISQTRSIVISPSSTKRLTAKSALSCDATSFTAVNDLALDLDDDVQFGSTNWEVCFNQRGLADAYTKFSLKSTNNNKIVEIALGGGVKIE